MMFGMINGLNKWFLYLIYVLFLLFINGLNQIDRADVGFRLTERNLRRTDVFPTNIIDARPWDACVAIDGLRERHGARPVVDFVVDN